jgi:RNA polymerase sigma-70 factor (ECF subfamily)
VTVPLGGDDSNELLAAPDIALTGAIDRLSLERAVAELPSGYRIVFILHDVEGYGHGEIARMLGLTAGTSKSQLHKARLRLRELLRAVECQQSQGGADSPPRNSRKKTGARRPSHCMEFVLG